MGNKLSVPVVDLSGKVAIVTGGNTGIGYELVRGLAEMGATVIMASRSEDRATSAIAKIKENSEKDLKIEFIHLDLASFQSTKDFVKAFKEKNLPLHILINNAGLSGMLFTRTDDGMELMYQVNHLCPFLLTLELLPNVIETASSSGDGRILFVSSKGHERSMAGPVNFETINTDIDYGRIKSYSRTKLYNVMTTYALQRRLQNVNITVSAQNPGLVQTDLKRGFADSKLYSLLVNFTYAVGPSRTPEQGAATTLNCAVNPELNSQTALYYDSMKVVPCNPDARNIEYQEELWKRSIEDLRDHLSPEILDKYGATLSTEQPTAATEPTVATQEETTTADETTQAVQTMAETAQTSVTEGTTETEQTSSTTGETSEAMTVTTVETEQTTTADDTADTTIGTEQTTTADDTTDTTIGTEQTTTADDTTDTTIGTEQKTTADDTADITIRTEQATTADDTADTTIETEQTTTADDTTIGTEQKTTADDTADITIGTEQTTTADDTADTTIGTEQTTTADDTTDTTIGTEQTTADDDTTDTTIGTEQTTADDTADTTIGTEQTTTADDTTDTTIETEQTTTADDTTDTTIGTEQTATADETEAAAETGAADETTEAKIPIEAEQTTAVVDTAEVEQTTTIESTEATTTETAAAKEGQ